MNKYCKILFGFFIGTTMSLSVLCYNMNKEIKTLDKIIDQQEEVFNQQEGIIDGLEQKVEENKFTIDYYDNELNVCKDKLSKKN